ncbi:MAG: hypothetical protein MZW92_50800 [Comamonadaceae bacterium]|nr:hypothetical protein [Comamonadaceae bacterium]
MIVRDRQALAILFVMPVLFVTILSLALRDVFTERAGATFDVLVVNQDPGDGRPEAGRHLCRRSPLPGDAANRAAAGRHPEPPGEQRPVPVRLRDPGARHPPGARTRHRAGARRRTGPRPDRGGRGAAVRRSDPARRPSRHGGGVHQRRAARHRIHADRRAHRRAWRAPRSAPRRCRRRNWRPRSCLPSCPTRSRRRRSACPHQPRCSRTPRPGPCSPCSSWRSRCR